MSGNANETMEPEIQSPEETAEERETEETVAVGEASADDGTSGPEIAEEEKTVSGAEVPVEEVPTEEETPAEEEAGEETSEEEAPIPKKGRVSVWARALAAPFLFWWAAILICELVVHTAAFESLERFSWGILFSAAAAALVAGLTTFPTLGGKLLSWLVPPALFLIYAVQLVYHHIFNAFMSLIYVSAGGDAITQFWDIALEAILQCAPRILAMAAPMLAFYILRHKGWLTKREAGVKAPLILLVCFAVLSALSVLAVPLGGTGVSSAYTALHSRSATVDRWTERFGLLTAETLDLKRLVADDGSGISADGMDLTAGAGASRNVLSGMDLDALDAQTDKKELQVLNHYFASLKGTGRNSYTGMFKGYNLIEICAESFSPYVIDPELTPTLYRLTHEGFVFEHFYNSFPSVTSDGEYSLCMGMMINLKRVSFASSMDNYLPNCMGNMFTSIGVPALAYHNNYATFYNRINTHTNMGYDFKAIDHGLDMEKGHPASDLEMFQKTVDDYINEDQFHAYYMTYSGHAPYNFNTNQMCLQNQSLTTGIDASEPVRAYYCGELELERALTYLVQRLEEAGIADRTVIVLTGDHYPYGLPAAAYEELAGEAVEEDPYWRYRNSFICWNGGMKEPVVVDDYCSTQDILPTLLNLFGFSYDSRLLTGRDVLADCVHVALLKDGSILTKEFLYDGTSGELTWQEGEEARDEDRAQEVIDAVEKQFAVAADVLDYDYYQYAYTTLGLSDGRVEHETFRSYSDTAGTYYEEAAEYMARYGIIVATNKGGCLEGEKVLPRAQMVVMLSRWLSLSGDPENLPYTDVKGSWAEKAVAGLWEAGLLPEGETELRAWDQTTQEDMIEMMATVAQYVGRKDAQAWAERIVGEAAAKQKVSNAEVPEGALTRGAMAYVLADLIVYAEENGMDVPGSAPQN